MPVTALQLPDPKTGGTRRLMFITQDFNEHLSIDVYQCDIDWNPMGQATLGTHIDDEETYHRKLREESSKRGHFMPEYSTNPEWSPGYVDPDEPPVEPDQDEFIDHEPHTEM